MVEEKNNIIVFPEQRVETPIIIDFPAEKQNEKGNVIFIDGVGNPGKTFIDMMEPAEGWTYSGSPDGRFVHIKDGNGNYRVRIDPSDKVTEYPHMHVLDGEGNALDVNGNIVPSNSPDAHIPR
ncbi:hypothetical protein [Clostridium sp. VAP41]|nr:hypothetical protein [Clostridium sp. VAP41]